MGQPSKRRVPDCIANLYDHSGVFLQVRALDCGCCSNFGKSPAGPDPWRLARLIRC